jgi:hypothetical protein
MAVSSGLEKYTHELFLHLSNDEDEITRSSAKDFLKELKKISDEYQRNATNKEKIDKFYSAIGSRSEEYPNENMYCHLLVSDIHDSLRSWFNSKESLSKGDFINVVERMKDGFALRPFDEINSKDPQYAELSKSIEKIYKGSKRATVIDSDEAFKAYALKHKEGEAIIKVCQAFTISCHKETETTPELHSNLLNLSLGDFSSKLSQVNRFRQDSHSEDTSMNYVISKARSLTTQDKDFQDYHKMDAVLQKVSCYHSLSYSSMVGNESSKSLMNDFFSVVKDNVKDMESGKNTSDALKELFNKEPYSTDPKWASFRVMEKFINNMGTFANGETTPQMLEASLMKTLRDDLSNADYHKITTEFSKACKTALTELPDIHWGLDVPKSFMVEQTR